MVQPPPRIRPPASQWNKLTEFLLRIGHTECVNFTAKQRITSHHRSYIIQTFLTIPRNADDSPITPGITNALNNFLLALPNL
jgi:hypothetical protein